MSASAVISPNYSDMDRTRRPRQLAWFNTLSNSLEDVSGFHTHKTSVTVFLIALPPATGPESIPNEAFYWHLFTGRRKITLDGLNSHARR